MYVVLSFCSFIGPCCCLSVFILGTHINLIMCFSNCLFMFLHSFQMNTPYQSYYVVSDCLFLSHLFGHITITLGWFVSSSPKLLSCFIWPLSKMLCRSSFETTLLLLLLSSQNSWPNTKKCFGSPKKLKRGGAYQHHLPIIIKVNKKTPKPLIAKIG